MIVLLIHLNSYQKGRSVLFKRSFLPFSAYSQDPLLLFPPRTQFLSGREGRPPHAPAPRPPSSSSCLGSACRLAGATQASPRHTAPHPPLRDGRALSKNPYP